MVAPRAFAADDNPVKIGLNDPLTGTYAELGKNEQIGCELAVEEINAKGGILGRKVQLLVEDSTSGDTGAAVQKGHKLIESRQGRLLPGQRELGHGRWRWVRSPTRPASSTSSPAATPTR